MLKTVQSYSFANKKALVRVDFNVPLDSEFNITDDTRIRAALPTLEKILVDGGSVIIMSHLGRPKEGPTNKYSLLHILEHLSKVLNRKVHFAADCIGDDAIKLAAELKSGEVLLLENLRFYKEEEKGNLEFAEKLSKLGNVYVNDAFGTAHRAHASTSVIAQFFPNDRVFGYLMAAEVENIEKVLNNAQKPFTAIMGGAKVSDKILIIQQLLNKVDNLIIGGGMAYTFAKAMGGQIGSSLVEEDKLELAKELISLAKAKGVNLVLPEDSIIADRFAADANTEIANNDNIPTGWMGLDIGPNACKVVSETILNSKTILWNGPMGVFEMEKFEKGTKTVADSVAKATVSGAFSMIGGGDSAAAINKFGMSNQVSYVSTGGGAVLEYIEKGSLPGVEAILNN